MSASTGRAAYLIKLLAGRTGLSALAIVTSANFYRTIHSFIDVHLARLREAFGVKWQKSPAYARSVASGDNSTTGVHLIAQANAASGGRLCGRWSWKVTVRLSCQRQRC